MTTREVTTIYRSLTPQERAMFRRDTNETLWLVVMNEYVRGRHRILGWAGPMPVIWEDGLSTYDDRGGPSVLLVADEDEAKDLLVAWRESRVGARG